jgi:segregation and condensation protein B
MERGWIREIGHREVPGRPALYATTRGFLDYFNLKSLGELPPLSEVKALIEPVLFQEADEDRDVADGSETLVEPGTKQNVVTLEDGINESSKFDESDGNGGEDGDELTPQKNDDEERPLAEVVKLPTPD